MDLFTRTQTDAFAIIIRTFELTERRVNRFRWKNVYARALTFMLKEELLSKAAVLRLIEARLLQLGRQAYKQVQHGRCPDHTTSPDALAYALARGEFSFWEQCRIRFDHGDTRQSFIAKYRTHDLPTDVLQGLMTDHTQTSTTTNQYTTRI